MAVPQSSNHELHERAIGGRRLLERKIRAIENLVTRSAEYVPNVVAAKTEIPAIRADGDRPSTPRERMRGDCDRAHAPRTGGRNIGVMAQILRDRRVQCPCIEAARPRKAGGDVAVESFGAGNTIAHLSQVRLVGRAPNLGWRGGRAAARRVVWRIHDSSPVAQHQTMR